MHEERSVRTSDSTQCSCETRRLLFPFADEENKPERNKHIKQISDRDSTLILAVSRVTAGKFLSSSFLLF